MIPNVSATGQSFKAAFAYFLHDKGQDEAGERLTTSERVAWIETRNLATDHPEIAWRIMVQTAARADELKREAGIAATGRKATGGPVYSYSLGWRADEAAGVTRADMIRAAIETLKLLKLDHLQAVIVAHQDTANPHVHVIVNRVDPTTGKTVSVPWRDFERLDAWARTYEKARGQIVTPKRQEREQAREKARQPSDALAVLTWDRSTFTRQDLARHVGRHTDSAEEFQAVFDRLEASPELVLVGHDEDGRERFTTRTHQAVERRMMNHATALHEQDRRAVPALEPKKLTLSEDQTAALRHVVGAERLSLIVGIAGTGKSTMMGAAKRSWEASGLTVRGLALSGIAADSLKNGSGINSQTIHSRLGQWERGTDLPTRKDVIVVDEAGMIGSRQMERILHFAKQGRAKVVLIGDPEQLQAIEAGGAFRMLADRFGAARLDTVRRQRETWQQDATRELATAATADAVARYEAAGMVHAHRTQDDAKAALVAAWREDAAARPGSGQIILAYTRADVRDLNDRARTLQREAGELGPDHALETATGKREFADGDRIYFLKNDSSLGVRNGTLATIERIERQTITAKLDGEDGRRVTFGIEYYNHIDHGYAATIHKSQGVTVDRAHLLASRNLDRHSTYVAMSRHRDRVDVHWSAETFESRDAMLRRLGRAAVKDTSLDYEAEAPAAIRAGKAIRQMSEQAAKSPRMPEERPKAPARPQTAAQALKLAHDAQKARHAAERDQLWTDQKARRQAIHAAAGHEIRDRVAASKIENRSLRADLDRQQKAERWRYDERERHVAGKVKNAIDAVTSRQIRGDGSDGGFLTMAFGYLASRDARRSEFDARQGRDRDQLREQTKSRLDADIGHIREARDRTLADGRATFTTASADLKGRQAREVADVRAQWKAIYAERERAAQAPKPEPAREPFKVKLRIKEARRETRAAWSDEQTRRAGVAAQYEAKRERRATAQQEPEVAKDEFDRARRIDGPPAPVPNRMEMLSRPAPAPSPAGDVPPVKKVAAPVPAIDTVAKFGKGQQAKQATPSPVHEWRSAQMPRPDPAPVQANPFQNAKLRLPEPQQPPRREAIPERKAQSQTAPVATPARGFTWEAVTKEGGSQQPASARQEQRDRPPTERQEDWNSRAAAPSQESAPSFDWSSVGERQERTAQPKQTREQGRDLEQE